MTKTKKLGRVLWVATETVWPGIPRVMVPKFADDWWTCGCGKWKGDELTAIKLHQPATARCRVCKCEQPKEKP